MLEVEVLKLILERSWKLEVGSWMLENEVWIFKLEVEVEIRS